MDDASRVDQYPLVWMAQVNGVLVDLRDMPREGDVTLTFVGHSFAAPGNLQATTVTDFHSAIALRR